MTAFQRPITIVAPIHVRSELNVHERWRAKAARARDQKAQVFLYLKAQLGVGLFTLPAQVTLTRYGVRLLDEDNLQSGFKAIRDTIATWLGCGDGPKDPVTWVYRQQTIKEVNLPKAWRYAIKIEIEALWQTKPSTS